MSQFTPTRRLASRGANAAAAEVGARAGLGRSAAVAAPAAGWSSGTIDSLKWFAFAAMAADHGAILVLADPFHPLRTLGRLALPIFLILLARNLAAGAGAGRYWMRLLPFALVAEIAWRAAEQAGAFRPPGANILFTLALAALFWAALRRAALSPALGQKLIFGLSALVPLALATRVDYGPTALVLVSCLALLMQLPPPWERQAGPGRERWPIDVVLWLGLFASSAFLALALNLAFFGSAALVALLPLGLLAVRGLPDIQLPRAPWWVFYALYPAHVAAFGVLGAVLRS